MAGRLKGKNHFYIGGIDGPENTQSSIGALYADPLFTPITDFGEEIFDSLFADFQTPSRDS
jgi:hypothetical protein